MLYKRDYRILTDSEISAIKSAEVFAKKHEIFPGAYPASMMGEYHEILPDAYYYNRSLFPNNYLDRSIKKKEKQLEMIEKEFIQILDSNLTERAILSFINNNEKFNLIGSIMHAHYGFGNHGAYLFKEFQLTTSYRADYLIIGKSSDGYHFIFVELESSIGKITLKDGSLGDVFRKGIKQVEDWDDWIEGNYNSLRINFKKCKNPDKELPEEFFVLDKSRIHFVVIAGRRKDFNEKTYRVKRKYLKERSIRLMHYDNLIDSFRRFQDDKSYG